MTLLLPKAGSRRNETHFKDGKMAPQRSQRGAEKPIQVKVRARALSLHWVCPLLKWGVCCLRGGGGRSTGGLPPLPSPLSPTSQQQFFTLPPLPTTSGNEQSSQLPPFLSSYSPRSPWQSGLCMRQLLPQRVLQEAKALAPPTLTTSPPESHHTYSRWAGHRGCSCAKERRASAKALR